MAQRQRAVASALAGGAMIVAALAGSAAGWADPADPPPPAPTTEVAPPPQPPAPSNPMTPHQPPVPVDSVPAAAPAAVPAPAAPVAPPPPAPTDPRGSVPNTVPPPGGSGGILGSIMDLWHQAKNPFAGPGDAVSGGMPAIPAGAGPAPALPPGYISTNAPGSETASTNGGAGSGPRPALPPGYYPTSGPPPPWFVDPTAPPPAAPAPGT